ncbi:unnamed protein product [Meloidogyne enterolobii]|uniref:Uncharacterized protein n=1 Tax=Meloidogyne enterolobii TaxID=390850 RepID=A0ACB0YAA7_MELEN
MSLIDNPLNGSTEIILENYFKEFLSTEDSNQINIMYLKISILSQVFLMEIAFDRVESGANIGLLSRFTMLCPFSLVTYEMRLCDIVTIYKSAYKKTVEKTEENMLSPRYCTSADDEKLKKIFLEFQEEIWEANFIVFFNYFINKKGESFQKIMRYV